MRRFIHPRRSASVVISACVAVAVAGGVSYAATSGLAGNADSASGGKLYACVTAAFHTLNLSSAGATCPNGQQKISWNVKGERGPKGARGPKGNTGSGGNTGATGAQGSKGDTGATGAQGLKGDTGATGPQGPKGDTGVSGATGPAGPPGAQGPAGPSTGPAGGDLSGNYPNPTIAAGAVTNSKLANSALTINAGTGLTGGGSTPLGGSTSLATDPTAVQTRVSGTCASGNAVSSINEDGSVGCQPTSTHTVLMGSSDGVFSASPTFLPPDGIGRSTSESDVDGIVPTDGVASNLHVSVTTSFPNIWTFELVVNGVITPLACTVDTTGGVVSCSGVSEPVVVSAGNTISLRADRSTSAGVISVSYGWTLTT